MVHRRAKILFLAALVGRAAAQSDAEKEEILSKIKALPLNIRVKLPSPAFMYANGGLDKFVGDVPPDTKIVGGEEADRDQFPFLVAMTHKLLRYQYCGGTLLSGGQNTSDIVVTASHCVDGEKAKNIRIYANRYDLSVGASEEGADESLVDEIIMHPQYNAWTTDYDIALLKLKTPLPVRIDTYMDEGKYTKPRVMQTVAGWGTLESGGDQPDRVNFVEVPMWPMKHCWRAYSGSITMNMVCCGYPGGGKDSCQGDSGGPLGVFVDHKFILTGVVSWGIGCAWAGYPGVYATVKELRDWVEANGGGPYSDTYSSVRRLDVIQV
jgi:trypsin